MPGPVSDDGELALLRTICAGKVNDRLQNLNRKIRQERREGDLTKAQARALRKEDRTIRDEERDMAKLDNGHITKTDQRLLNHQENELRSDIPK